ncbi:hypothetical protein BST28156_07045 [Burkholderia stagnalis]|nr:hypothetical protein BST28156_07045 [Burkholderia stagnalis]
MPGSQNSASVTTSSGKPSMRGRMPNAQTNAAGTAATVPWMNAFAPAAGLPAVASSAQYGATTSSIMSPWFHAVAIQNAPVITIAHIERTPFSTAERTSR